jgi:hypothetical protein
MMPRR